MLALVGARSSLAPAVGAVVLAGHQLAVPRQDGLGREQRAELAQQLPPQLHARRREPTPLGVVQDDPLLAKLLPQDAVFLAQVGDHVLLLPVHPAGNGHNEELPRCEGHAEEDSWRRAMAQVDARGPPCAQKQSLGAGNPGHAGGILYDRASECFQDSHRRERSVR